MHALESIGIWLGVFVLYFAVEFVINLFFTYKIKHIGTGDYTKAAMAGSISTFLFMFSTLLAAAVGVALIDGVSVFSQAFVDSKILFILWTTFALSVGNFCATIAIPLIEKVLKKNKEVSKEETKEKEN